MDLVPEVPVKRAHLLEPHVVVPRMVRANDFSVCNM